MNSIFTSNGTISIAYDCGGKITQINSVCIYNSQFIPVVLQQKCTHGVYLMLRAT